MMWRNGEAKGGRRSGSVLAAAVAGGLLLGLGGCGTGIYEDFADAVYDGRHGQRHDHDDDRFFVDVSFFSDWWYDGAYYEDVYYSDYYYDEYYYDEFYYEDFGYDDFYYDDYYFDDGYGYDDDYYEDDYFYDDEFY